MIQARKILQISALIFLGLFAASCEPGCVESDEFDSESIVIESNPTTDGIYGTYDSIDGGQRAEWHETGLKSNGEKFLIQISGSWTAWNGEEMTDAKLKTLPRCNFCARRSANGSPNCICYPGKNPTIEIGSNGEPVSPLANYCSGFANQNDPAKCSCTQDPQYGTALDYGVYHFPLDVLNKDETSKIADRQDSCKYDRGMGAYVALFGARGIDVPKRVYHLYSETEVCNIVRDSNGLCLDSNGNDVTRYVFQSANNRIFMKDDNAGNTGIDNNTADDIYHKPNENLKVIIYDRYYSDNFGRYNLTVLRGVGNNNDAGLLEYLVRLVEDVLLGTINGEGEREGGIIEFMYKAIVQDSGFITVVQITLSLYIAFYGLAHLLGLAEINKKELLTRLLKIGIIVFFTSKDSWYFYNKIVVAFFKDSMDYVVSVIMSMSDSNIDASSMIKISQLDREADISNATRFSYVDLTIKKLMAAGTAKKIFGLFFGTPFFGLLYIPVIYALIGFFIYVMLLVGSIYVINLMKIIFVLCLGPIFMCFMLFSHTKSMFNNWLAYLGARSLEIVLLFAVLYNFLLLIDKNFTDMLTYRACLEYWGLSGAQIPVLKSYINRSFIEWILIFVTLGGLMFIMKLVINQVATLAGSLISIGGVANKSDAGASHAGGTWSSAGGIMGQGMGLMRMAASKGLSMAGSGGILAMKAATAGARASGVAGVWNAAGDAVGVRGPRSRMRDWTIDSEINKARKAAKAEGLTGAKAENAVRKSVFDAMQKRLSDDPNKMALMGVNLDAVARRLDQKLVVQPARDEMKKAVKELRSGKAGAVPMTRKEMKAAIDKRLNEWAGKNLAGGVDALSGHLSKGSMKKMMDSVPGLSTSEAAKAFGKDADSRNKYLDYLRNQEFKRDRKAKEAWEKGSWSGAKDWLSRAAGNLTRSTDMNPKLARENFMFKTDKMDKPLTWRDGRWWNPLKGVNVVDKTFSGERFGDIYKTSQRERNALIRFLAEESKPRPGEDAKKAAKRAAKEQSKKGYFEGRLAEAATRGIVSEYAAIAASQRPGISQPSRLGKPAARSEVHRRTADLLLKAGQEFLTPNGDSLFEKTARLSYLHKQLGMSGEDPQLALSRMLREEAIKRADALAVEVQSGSKSADAARREAEALDRMKAGLFTTDVSNPLAAKVLADFNASALAALNDLQAGKALGDPQALAGNADALNDDQRQTAARLKELSETIEARAKAEAEGRAPQEADAYNAKIKEEKAERELADSTARQKKSAEDADLANDALGKAVKEREEVVALEGSKKDELELATQEKERLEREAAQKAADLAAAIKEKERAEAAADATALAAAVDAQTRAKDSSELAAREAQAAEDKRKALEDEVAALAARRKAAEDAESEADKLAKRALDEARDAEAKRLAANAEFEKAQIESAAVQLRDLAGKAKEVAEIEAKGPAATSQEQDLQQKLRDEARALLEDAKLHAAADVSASRLEKSVQAADARIDAILADTTRSIDERKAAVEVVLGEVKKEAGGLMATSFKVEFGGSITEVLLQSPDVGLKAGNIFLGVAEAQKGVADPAVVNGMRIAKNQAQGKAKVSKLEKKMKDFELMELQKDPVANKSKIADLEKEIASLDKDISQYEREVAEIEDAGQTMQIKL